MQMPALWRMARGAVPGLVALVPVLEQEQMQRVEALAPVPGPVPVPVPVPVPTPREMMARHVVLLPAALVPAQVPAQML